MIARPDHQDLRRLLHTAAVLREKREYPDRRQHIVYPRGGRRASDDARLAEYRSLVRMADPFRWQRQVAGWAGTIGGALAVAGAAVALAMWMGVR